MKKKKNEQLEFEKKRFEELQLYHKSSFDLYVKKSNIPNSGYGVFTKSFIPKDSFIDFYYGNLCTSIKGGSYFIYINDEYGIDACGVPRCYMAMLNDSYNSEYTNNCEFIIEDLTVSIKSFKDIEIDSELFLSYGDSYWI
jgi:hypothetical protein